MFAPRRIESEILLALYRYSLLTIDQLATLLHYERKTIYKAFHTLKEKDWVQSLPLGFVERNVKGWTLFKNGVEVAFGLTTEYRARLLKQTNVLSGQTAHLYRSNRFFTDLIQSSLARPTDEGLIDWIGMRDSGDRYPMTTPKGQKTTPLRPDGIGTYRFANGSEVIFHVEYDTGSEHLWVIHSKLWQYVDVLKTFWTDLSLASVLFITRDSRRSARIMEIWKDLKEDVFRRQPVPAVWTTIEDTLDEQGAFGSVWMGAEDTVVTFQDFPRLNGENGVAVFLSANRFGNNRFPNGETDKVRDEQQRCLQMMDIYASITRSRKSSLNKSRISERKHPRDDPASGKPSLPTQEFWRTGARVPTRALHLPPSQNYPVFEFKRRRGQRAGKETNRGIVIHASETKSQNQKELILMKRLLTAPQVAEHLGLTEDAVYRWARQKVLLRSN